MQRLKKMPPTAAKFFQDGGTQAGSPERRTAAQHLRDKSHAFAKHLLHQGKEVKDGLHGIAKLVHIRSWDQLDDHSKKAIKSLGVEAATLAGGIALTGGLSHLVHAPAMIALKHVGGHWFAEAAMKAAGHSVVHGSTETAGIDEQKMLVGFINSLADMLESGDIPDEAWEKTADDIAGAHSGMHPPPQDAVTPHPRDKTVTDDVTDSPRPGVSSEDLKDETDPREDDDEEVEEVPTEAPGDDHPREFTDKDEEGQPEGNSEQEPVGDDQPDDGEDIGNDGRADEDKEVPTNPDGKVPEGADEPVSSKDDPEAAEDEVEEIPLKTDDSGKDSTFTQNDEKPSVGATPEPSGDSDLSVEPADEDIDEVPDENKQKVQVKEDVKPCSNCGHAEEEEDDDIEEIPLKKEDDLEKSQAATKPKTLPAGYKIVEGPQKGFRFVLLPNGRLLPNQGVNDYKTEQDIIDNFYAWKKTAGKKTSNDETSRIKGADEYTWLRYTGKPIILNFRGTRFTLTKGMEFGVRMSSNKKDKRLIVDAPDMGLTKVITLTPELEDHLKTRVERV